MPTQMVRQTMFTAGEVDTQVFKRTDIESYLTACQSLLNMECGTTALAKKRRGTRVVLDVTSVAIDESQMYEFVDKNGDFYLILSTNLADYIYLVDPVTGDLTLNATTPSVVTPYTAADLFHIDYTLDNDSIVFVDPNYPPARVYVSSYGTTPPTFAYQVLNIYPLPSYDFGDVDYSQAPVVFTSTATTFTMTLTGQAGLFPNPGTDWINGEVVSLGLTTSQPIGYGVITSAANSGGDYVFSGRVYLPFAQPDTDMPTIGAQYSIRKPAWSNTLGWPSATTFYQNRLWFANTKALPSTIFGSKLNQPVNFDVGAGNDTDAIIYAIGQNDTGRILWLNGGKQLEIYTENFEFACPQDPSVGITPGTFSVRQQSSYGSSTDMKPVTYINDSYYAAKTGQAIINFHFDGIGLTYKSSNISLQSSHLMNNPINRALQRSDEASQDNFIYFLNEDSSVTSFQFVNELKLAAMTPIRFNQAIQVIDVATINNKIYFLKKYTLGGQFVIEIFDNSLRMDSVNTFTVAPFSTTPPLGVVTGLTDYIGYTVHFVYQDQDYGTSLDSSGLPAVVDNTGTAYVFNPIGALLTGDIEVGILYENNITPMYLFAGALQSNYFKFITKIYVDYYLSLDFQVDGTQVPFQSFSTFTLTPQTDTYVLSTVDGWNRFKSFTITQSSPFDLQILGIAYQIDAKII